MTAIFKVADESLKQRMRESRQPHRPSLLGIFALNAASLLLITLLLCSLRESKSELKKQQSLETDGSEMLSDPLRRFYNQRRLSRIMRESAYSQTDSSIGVSLQRKQVRRPVHLITEDMLLSVKEVKQRELKKYFNESEESEIGLLGINHHLSLSHSISYEQEEHDNNQQIIELDDISQ